MLLGLRTVIYPTKDLAKATRWWSKQLGFAPYFEQPFYVGFNVGGYELGLLPPGDEDADDTPTTYWGVADMDEAVAHFVSHGATVLRDAKDVGDGISVATLLDPFGNAIGLIVNPHFAVKEEPPKT